MNGPCIFFAAPEAVGIFGCATVLIHDHHHSRGELAARDHMDAHSFLLALTVVLGAAALTTVVFQRFRQPVVLGYILAGFIIGPNVPIPVVADRQIVQTLSELGVILLMFSLGPGVQLGQVGEARSGREPDRTAAIELDDLVGFRHRSSPGLDNAREPFHRLDHRYFEHDDHRQGLR